MSPTTTTNDDDNKHDTATTPPPPLNLDTIPVEVLLQIFNFVDATDLLRRVSLVSKYFHGILRNEMTWKIKQEKRWGAQRDDKYPPIDLLPEEEEEEEIAAAAATTTTTTTIGGGRDKDDDDDDIKSENKPEGDEKKKQPKSLPSTANNNNNDDAAAASMTTNPITSSCYYYSAQFTQSSFPWSRACVKREEQIKLWSSYSYGSNDNDANAAVPPPIISSRLVHTTVNSHIGCIDSVHLFVRNSTMLLACGSRDRSISVWNVEQLLSHPAEDPTRPTASTARIKILTRAHDGWIWDFSVNSNHLLSCSWDTIAKAWDCNTWQATGQFRTNTSLLSISTTDTLTALGTFNRKVLLLDPRTSFTTAAASSSSSSPGGNRSTTTSTPIHTFVSHTRSVLSVGLDSNYLISCGEDGLCVKHDIRAMKKVASFKLPVVEQEPPPPPPPPPEMPAEAEAEAEDAPAIEEPPPPPPNPDDLQDFLVDEEEDAPALEPQPPQPRSPNLSPYPTCMSFRDTNVGAPYFYLGDNTGALHLVDLLNFRVTRSTRLHSSPVRGVFHNLGSVLSCSKFGNLEVRDPTLGLGPIASVHVGNNIELPCVHSLNNVVACGGGDGVVRLWGEQ